MFTQIRYTTSIKTSEWSATIACGYVKTSYNEDTDKHSHFDEELMIITKGNWRWSSSKYVFNIKPGDVVIVPSLCKHETKREDEEGERFAIRVRFSQKCGALLTNGTPSYFHSDLVISLMEEFQKATSQIKDSIISLIINMSLSQKKLSQNKEKTISKETKSLLSEVDLLITENYKDPSFNIGQAAKELSLSSRECERICKKRFGKTFTQLLREKRIETALELLNNNAKPTFVYKEIGYSNYVSFYRDFKLLAGRSPSSI